MKTKYGFVVLIDALGTKTDSIKSSEHYLKAVGDIEEDIKLSHIVISRNKQNGAKFFKNLKIRFFGDTLLLTYEVKDKVREFDYFHGLSFVLRSFIIKTLP